MDPSNDTSRYTVGWIAPLALELTAAIGMLEDHTMMPAPEDDVIYHVGHIGLHFVVMVVCPRIGIEPAATALANMRRSFPNIKHVLVVGIAGGVPCYGPDLREQIVLGDVVVGVPQHGSGGVTHYEFGTWEDNNELTVKGHTLHPSSALLTAVNNLRSAHMMAAGSRIPEYLQECRMGLNKRSRQAFEDPGAENDHLFEDDYVHPDRGRTCEGLCDTTRAKRRDYRGYLAERETDQPEIHYGNIGSANAVVRPSAKRNELRARHNIICLEMEAAGVMSDYQGLVIRGICDYADSHKNKKWQAYAAATAAAYAKEVLMLLPSGKRVSTESSSSDDRNEDSSSGSGRGHQTFHNSGTGIMSFNAGSGSLTSNNAVGTQYNNAAGNQYNTPFYGHPPSFPGWPRSNR
ncbi:nucleoside phosphorylase domain-containing protein [Pseudoneurospora amorphoporcata]|uniref:Nucleoside phosphorylase domain-containing protein n=1 Tax=Pseudoneurospora amorphoporcata TaxID=241081 RepID=A0AAN6SA45_9PEZI|nr:nucleoside phosphorylase domain-containing protein [Pseudoneurospora amorphoporcata]